MSMHDILKVMIDSFDFFMFSTGRRSRITDEIDWKERNCFCDPGIKSLDQRKETK